MVLFFQNGFYSFRMVLFFQNGFYSFRMVFILSESFWLIFQTNLQAMG